MEEEDEEGDEQHKHRKRIFLNKGYDTAECVLCREKASTENTSKNYNKPMGLIALCKRNRIPAIICEQEMRRERLEKEKQENMNVSEENKGKEKEPPKKGNFILLSLSLSLTLTLSHSHSHSLSRSRFFPFFLLSRLLS